MLPSYHTPTALYLAHSNHDTYPAGKACPHHFLPPGTLTENYRTQTFTFPSQNPYLAHSDDDSCPTGKACDDAVAQEAHQEAQAQHTHACVQARHDEGKLNNLGNSMAGLSSGHEQMAMTRA